MKEINDYLHRTAQLLIRNASFIEPIGLIDGKMGIAVFLYTYARYANKEIYTKYADELIDEILQSLSHELPLNTNSGISGIGVGLDYLARNHFVEIESEKTFLDIDFFMKKKEVLFSQQAFDIINLNSFAYWKNRPCSEETNHRIVLLISRLEGIFNDTNQMPPLPLDVLAHSFFVLKMSMNQQIAPEKTHVLQEKIHLSINQNENLSALMFHLWNNLFPEKRIDKTYILSLKELITLSNLQLIYSSDIETRTYYENTTSKIPEKRVLTNILNSANMQNLGLKYYPAGTAWFLINYIQSKTSCS